MFSFLFSLKIEQTRYIILRKRYNSIRKYLFEKYTLPFIVRMFIVPRSTKENLENVLTVLFIETYRKQIFQWSTAKVSTTRFTVLGKGED